MSDLYRTKQNEKPTKQQFDAYLNIFNYLNKELFNNELPQIFLNLSRETSNVYGWFAPEKWISNNRKIHELSLNPRSMACLDAKETISTITHEMVHLWQHEFGKPSRVGYHNKEWADKMESVGLMPSDTGVPGGKRTGQSMNDYIIPGGKLDQIIKKIPQQYLLPWVSIEAIQYLELKESREKFFTTFMDNIRTMDFNPVENEDHESIKTVAMAFEIDNQILQGIKENPVKQYANKNKTKYICPECKVKVWGKSGLNILCGDCDHYFEESP